MVRSLLAADLVDELLLTIEPIILGGGKPRSTAISARIQTAANNIKAGSAERQENWTPINNLQVARDSDADLSRELEGALCGALPAPRYI